MRRPVPASNTVALRRQVADLTERLQKAERLMRGNLMRVQRAELATDELRTVLILKRVLAEEDLPTRTRT